MERKRRPMFNYMDRVQHMVTVNMRGIFMDWLVEVVVEYKLLSKTLNLSMSYIHRFLSVNPMSKSRLQLLDVSSMLIASKYEEVNPPGVDKFYSITNNTYEKAEVSKYVVRLFFFFCFVIFHLLGFPWLLVITLVVEMEAKILASLNFEIGNPTAITFLRSTKLLMHARMFLEDCIARKLLRESWTGNY
ncbi:putative cyclin-A3-1 [Glycine soja]